jgi:meso-butanediol dehydrogenase/(S,S)-butanediol dehydrogenase/diacetyl reductase
MPSHVTSQRFDGKTAVVTAAASGIGAAVARRLHDEGATVLASDLDIDALEKTFADLSSRRLHLGQLDVSRHETVRDYVADVTASHPTIDVLVNNAGMGSWGAVDDLELERWHTVLAITLDSVFYTCKELMPFLRRAKGSIVNISSISGMYADNGFAAYNAAKAGVINLTRTIALDHARDGVRANVVAPGLTDTPRVTWMDQTEAIADEYARRLPTPRKGTAEEMAAAVAFLASDEASYITGVVLPVDGGLTATAGQPPFLQLLPERVPAPVPPRDFTSVGRG